MKPKFHHDPWDISLALAVLAGAVLAAAVAAVVGVVVAIIEALR